MTCLPDDELVDLIDRPEGGNLHLRDCPDCQLRRAELAVAARMVASLKPEAARRPALGVPRFGLAVAAATLVAVTGFLIVSGPGDGDGQATPASPQDGEAAAREFDRRLKGLTAEPPRITVDKVLHVVIEGPAWRAHCKEGSLLPDGEIRVERILPDCVRLSFKGLTRDLAVGMAGDARVTIEGRNLGVAQVLEKFRKQVPGVRFETDLDAWGDDFRIKELDLRDEPWYGAFIVFLTLADATLDERTEELVRFSRVRRVTFSFKDTDIRTVIDLIARISGANVVIHADVRASVSLSVNNLPWNEVLAQVVKGVGPYTTVQEEGGIVRILPWEVLRKQMEPRVFRLAKLPRESKDLDTLRSALGVLLTDDAAGTALGTADYDPAVHSITVTDLPAVLAKAAFLVERYDREPAGQTER